MWVKHFFPRHRIYTVKEYTYYINSDIKRISINFNFHYFSSPHELLNEINHWKVSWWYNAQIYIAMVEHHETSHTTQEDVMKKHQLIRNKFTLNYISTFIKLMNIFKKKMYSWMRALKDSLIRFVLHSHWLINLKAYALINATIRLLLLYVRFLRRSPRFYAEREYIGANRSRGTQIKRQQ